MVVRFHPTPQKLNDRMVRVYEGDALQTRLEKSTSGVRISLRSHLKILEIPTDEESGPPAKRIAPSGVRVGTGGLRKIQNIPVQEFG